MINIKKKIVSLYRQLIAINDSPQKKAIGLGLGIFIGNFPGVGPVAALTIAWLVKVNKAAALLGSILTNTWMSLLTLGLSIRIGSFIRGEDWHLTKDRWNGLFKDFSLKHLDDFWSKLTDKDLFQTFISILIGYFIVSLIIALIAYLTALFIFQRKLRKITP